MLKRLFPSKDYHEKKETSMNYLPHVIALIIGVILLWIFKRKYKKIHNRELIIVFILFLILVAIFTAPGMDLIKKFINFIQIE